LKRQVNSNQPNALNKSSTGYRFYYKQSYIF
jgi:hypothetical protein